jgi:hypothetical protein
VLKWKPTPYVPKKNPPNENFNAKVGIRASLKKEGRITQH